MPWSILFFLLPVLTFSVVHGYCNNPPAGSGVCFSTRDRLVDLMVENIGSSGTSVTKTEWEQFWMSYSNPELRLSYGSAGSDLVFNCYAGSGEVMTRDSIKNTCCCFGTVQLSLLLCEALNNKASGNLLS